MQDTHVASHRAGLDSRIYYGLRLFLHRRRWLLRFAQVARSYVVFGPFRNILLSHYRRSGAGRHRPIAVDRSSLFSDAPSAAAAAEQLNDTGYARLGELHETSVERILAFCDVNRQTKFWNPHLDCDEVDRVARNEFVVDIARQYLGAEPVLWLTALKWTLPRPEGLGFHLPPHGEMPEYDTNAFHYDILDCKSLTLFIYLTDVDADSCAHVIVEGTHQRKSLSEIRHIIVADDVVQKKYGRRVKTILGRRGTAFIEDTSSIHKVSAGRKNRLIMSIDYVIGRTPPPERPHVPPTGHRLPATV